MLSLEKKGCEEERLAALTSPKVELMGKSELAGLMSARVELSAVVEVLDEVVGFDSSWSDHLNSVCLMQECSCAH